MKRLFFMIVIISLLCTGCGQKTQENGLPKKIRIGTIRVANDKTVADELEIFKEAFAKYDIEVEMIFFDSGTAANIAFGSGAIDFAGMGYTNSVIALSKGINVELVWIHEVLGKSEALVVQKNRDIHGVEDLVGKTIATPFASTSHLSLVKTLELHGITKDQVTLLDMNTVDIVAAWKRGDIDAAYSWEPTLSELKENGNVLITSEDLAKEGITTVNVDLANKDFLEKYPQLAVEYIRALAKAGEIYKKEPNTAIESAAKSLHITPKQAQAQMEGTIWLTPKDQISSKYFGTRKHPGQFLELFYETGVFLEQERKITHIPTKDEIKEFINPIYIEKALEGESYD
ncbi:MAG: ABC transporter substrate-binding protein [Tissierellia bacterium]|nr:ABC transporter substrate-binding protein [Tissierellia bacterium]